MSRSRSPRASCSGSSGRTAPARRRCSTCSRGSDRPTSGRCASTGATSPTGRRTGAPSSGLGRTFQVSNVFPLLPVQENVRLAAEAALGGTLAHLAAGRSVARRSSGRTGRSSASGSRRAAALPAGSLCPRRQAPARARDGARRRRPACSCWTSRWPASRSSTCRELVELIRSMHAEERKTVLMVEHHIDVVTGLARADRRDAPRRLAGVRHAGRDDGRTRRCSGPTWGRPVMRGAATDAPEVARPARAPRRVAHPAGRRLRRARGRRDRAARPQRRRQDDDAARDPRPRRSPRAHPRSDGDGAHGLPTHRIVRRGIGYVPEDRDVFAGLTVGGEPRARRARGEPRLRPRLRAVPGAAGTRRRSGPAHSRAGSSRWSRSRGRCSNDNRVLLVDEPTKGLAPLLVAEVAHVLDRVAERTTVLLVEQNLGWSAGSPRRGRARHRPRGAYRPRAELLADEAMVIAAGCRLLGRPRRRG